MLTIIGRWWYKTRRSLVTSINFRKTLLKTAAFFFADIFLYRVFQNGKKIRITKKYHPWKTPRTKIFKGWKAYRKAPPCGTSSWEAPWHPLCSITTSVVCGLLVATFEIPVQGVRMSDASSKLFNIVWYRRYLVRAFSIMVLRVLCRL